MASVLFIIPLIVLLALFGLSLRQPALTDWSLSPSRG